MAEGRPGGDRTDSWRTSYGRVRKDPLRSTDATNRQRLAALGADELSTAAAWVDVGAGDGNLARLVAASRSVPVVAVEPQPSLLPPPGAGVHPMVGSATALPLAAGSVAVALVMDVLHHLPPKGLRPALAELRRVLRPGGHVLVWEPAATRTRRVLGVALDSPLSSLTAFTRDKRTMVDAERDTLEPWLAGERRFLAVAADAGFAVERTHRHALHAYHRLRAPG